MGACDASPFVSAVAIARVEVVVSVIDETRGKLANLHSEHCRTLLRPDFSPPRPHLTLICYINLNITRTIFGSDILRFSTNSQVVGRALSEASALGNTITTCATSYEHSTVRPVDMTEMEWEGDFDPMADPEEQRHLLSVLDSFR